MGLARSDGDWWSTGVLGGDVLFFIFVEMKRDFLCCWLIFRLIVAYGLVNTLYSNQDL